MVKRTFLMENIILFSGEAGLLTPGLLEGKACE